MSKLVRLQRREQSSDGVNWYPLDTYRVAYVIEEESNCQDDDIVYTRWVNTSEFECENGTKHFLAKKQLSYDNQSWFDANPIEYRRNGITVSGAWECQGIEPTAPYSRLVETDLWECGDNYTKHYLSERQFSYDNIEWFSYIPKKYEWDATRTEYDSKDCGYIPPREQSVHLYFTDGTEDWVFHPYSYIEPHYYDGINGIYGRKDIEKVEIGQMLISIDEYAFANQPNLKEAYFEDYVIDGANNIFFGDQMLCKVNDNPRGTLRLSTEVLGNGAFNYTAFDTVILDEGNKSIGVSTFGRMGNLTSVTLPSTVETISDYTFEQCTSLTSITIPNSVTAIESGAFSQCGLYTVNIPSSVTSIGNGAFGGCDNLTSVTIPNSVTSIGSNVFVNCPNLRYLYFDTASRQLMEGQSLSTTDLTIRAYRIEEGAFSNLLFDRYEATLRIEHCDYIANNAFGNCKYLTSVEFDNYFGEFEYGKSIFSGCTNLKTLKFTSTREPRNLNDYTFDGMPRGGICYVPNLANYTTLTYFLRDHNGWNIIESQ